MSNNICVDCEENEANKDNKLCESCAPNGWSDYWFCPCCGDDLTLHKSGYVVNETSECQSCGDKFYLESRYRITKVEIES